MVAVALIAVVASAGAGGGDVSFCIASSIFFMAWGGVVESFCRAKIRIIE